MKETAMTGSGQYEFGKFIRNGYKSVFLGYKCKSPKGGIFSPENDLLRMSGINPGLKASNPMALRDAYCTGQAVMDMFLNLPSGADIAIYWQYHPANCHGSMDLARMVAQRQIQVNLDKGWTPEGEIHHREIMGREFTGLTSHYTNPGGEIEYIKEYFYECVNGMISIAVKMSRYNFSDGDLLLESLKKL